MRHLPVENKIAMESVTSILVIHVTRIGDTLLTTPSLRAIAARYPGAALTFLGHPKRAEVVKNLPYVSSVGTITKKQAAFLGRIGGKRYQIAFVYGFDEALVEYALRVSEKVVAFRQKSGSLNHRLFRCVPLPPPMSMHAVDQLMLLPKSMGIEVAGRQLDFSLSSAEREWGGFEIASLRQQSKGPLVGLQIASFPTKAYRDWPLESFKALADKIINRWPSTHFLIFGGNDEASRTNELARHLGVAATNYSGHLSLRQTAALMNELDIYIGVDTGPTHMMGALHRPMIALYHGFSHSGLLAPLDHPCAIAVDHPLAGKGATPDTPMGDISVDEVWQAVTRTLEGYPTVVAYSKEASDN